MTLYIPSNTTFGQVSFNTPNLSGDYDLVIQSQWGKEVWVWSLVLLETNDRYTEFTLTFTSDEQKAHVNGIYNYQLQQDGNVIESGLLKLVVEDGGSFGTTEYISDNDDREATVYYRPEY
jgi:hypothetical protein